MIIYSHTKYVPCVVLTIFLRFLTSLFAENKQQFVSPWNNDYLQWILDFRLFYGLTIITWPENGAEVEKHRFSFRLYMAVIHKAVDSKGC